MTNAANVELEPIWATLLAKALEGKNVKDLLSNVGSGGGGPAVSAAPAAGGGDSAPAAAAKVEEKKEEPKEESDDDMVRSFALSGGFDEVALTFGSPFAFSVCAVDVHRVSACSIDRVLSPYLPHLHIKSLFSPTAPLLRRFDRSLEHRWPALGLI